MNDIKELAPLHLANENVLTEKEQQKLTYKLLLDSFRNDEWKESGYKLIYKKNKKIVLSLTGSWYLFSGDDPVLNDPEQPHLMVRIPIRWRYSLYKAYRKTKNRKDMILLHKELLK